MKIVDAYVHCGLRKYYPVERVLQVMDLAAVTRAVLVQHLGEFDNSYIGNSVANDRRHLAGVGLVDHTAADPFAKLATLAASGNFKGIRFTTDMLEDAPDLWEAAVNSGLIIVLYAPDGMGPYIGPLEQFLSANPKCRLVLTHMGNPDLREAPHFKTDRAVFALAQYPGVYYQLSGMKMFCPYPHKELYPLIAEAVRQFGTSRLLWGSNYPVVGNDQDYVRDLHLALDGRIPIPDNAIGDVTGGNAQRLWFAEIL